MDNNGSITSILVTCKSMARRNAFRRGFRYLNSRKKIKWIIIVCLYTSCIFIFGRNFETQTSTLYTSAFVGGGKPRCEETNETAKNGIGASNYKVQVKQKSLCVLPKLDPFDPKIMDYIHQDPTLDCTGNSPSLVDVVGSELRVNPTKVKAKLKSGSIDRCRYRALATVAGYPDALALSSWSDDFTDTIRVADDEEYFQVQCFYKNEMVSVSFLSMVRKKTEVEVNRLKDFITHITRHNVKESPNVLFLGIDGMSKENVIRTMPKTKKFIVEKLKAVEFKKFNKVGMNTYPNVVPLLTGLFAHELPSNWNEDMALDSIDHLFLWKRYQDAGYRTSVIFDNTYQTAFTYLKRGWDNPSFDYFPRALVMEAELGDNPGYRKTDENCMGDSPEVTELLYYLFRLAAIFNSTETPYFAYSFFTRLTHDDQNKASAGDELYLEFFREMAKYNLLNNTVLVFFSDHGLRFGPLRDTYNGVFESKLPFLFFIFPPWFERKYPKLMATFRNNADNLMTPFDIHATMEDLLQFRGEVKEQTSPATRAISLFSPIPRNRTCQDAGIPLEYCACALLSTENLASSNVSKALVAGLLNEIVDATSMHRDKCAILRHKETKRILTFTPETPFRTDHEFLYYVTIQTTPGDAVYEATLYYDSDGDYVTILDDIIRLNLYRGQADCVDDHRLRRFCYCNNNINDDRDNDNRNNNNNSHF